jgi:hypothetical protein
MTGNPSIIRVREGLPTNWTQSASHLCLSSKLSAMIGGAFFELRVAKGMRRKPNAQTATI